MALALVQTSTRDANHARFQQRLRDSEAARWVAGPWWSCRGWVVELSPMSFSPNPDDWQQHIDNGDMYVWRPATPDQRHRVEVKHLTRNFTCADDWGYPDVILCAKHSYDRADPKPWGYMLFSGNLKHMALIRGSSHAQWRADTTSDRDYQDRVQRTYFAPFGCVKFQRYELKYG